MSPDRDKDCSLGRTRTITGWDDPDGPRTHGDGIYVIKGKAWRVIGPRAIEADRTERTAE